MENVPGGPPTARHVPYRRARPWAVRDGGKDTGPCCCAFGTRCRGLGQHREVAAENYCPPPFLTRRLATSITPA